MTANLYAQNALTLPLNRNSRTLEKPRQMGISCIRKRFRDIAFRI